MLQTIQGIEDELNGCIVQQLQREGAIVPALKQYDQDAADKINKEFNDKMKTIESQNKQIKTRAKEQHDRMFGVEEDNSVPVKRVDILSSISHGQMVHYNPVEGLQWKIMQQEHLKREGYLKPRKQEGSSTSAESDKVGPVPLTWTDKHSSKLDELMTKYEEDIDQVHRRFNRYLNGACPLQRNYVYNIDKQTLHFIWKDIHLRNELLSDARREEHRYKMREWMEEER